MTSVVKSTRPELRPDRKFCVKADKGQKTGANQGLARAGHSLA